MPAEIFCLFDTRVNCSFFSICLHKRLPLKTIDFVNSYTQNLVNKGADLVGLLYRDCYLLNNQKT